MAVFLYIYIPTKYWLLSWIFLIVASTNSFLSLHFTSTVAPTYDYNLYIKIYLSSQFKINSIITFSGPFTNSSKTNAIVPSPYCTWILIVNCYKTTQFLINFINQILTNFAFQRFGYSFDFRFTKCTFIFSTDFFAYSKKKWFFWINLYFTYNI